MTEPTTINLADVRDDPGLFAKVVSGKEGWATLNKVDGMRFVGLLSMKSTGVLGAVGGAVDTAADLWDINRQRAELEKTIGVKRADIRGEVLNEADDEDGTRKLHAVGKGVAVTGAGMAGAGIVSAIASGAATGTMMAGPWGTVAGIGVGIAASMLAAFGYDATFTSSLNDSLGLSGKLLFAQMQGVEIPAEAAFASWAASQPKGTRDILERKLSEYTNGEVTHFHEALTKGKTEALQKLMVEFDADMKMDPNLNLDMASSKSAAQQLAEQMNSRGDDGKPVFIANRLISQDHLEAVMRLHAEMNRGRSQSPTDNLAPPYQFTTVDGMPSATDNTGLPPIPGSRFKGA